MDTRELREVLFLRFCVRPGELWDLLAEDPELSVILPSLPIGGAFSERVYLMIAELERQGLLPLLVERLKLGEEVPLSFSLPVLGVPRHTLRVPSATESARLPEPRFGGAAPTEVEFQFRLDGPQVHRRAVVQGSEAVLTFFLAPEDPAAMGAFAAKALRGALTRGGSLGVMLVPFGLELKDEACRKTAKIVDGGLDHEIGFVLKAGAASDAAGIWVHVDLDGVPLGAFFLAIPVIEDAEQVADAPRKKLWIDLDAAGQPVDALLSINQGGGLLFVHCSATDRNKETLFVTQGVLEELSLATLQRTLMGVQESAKVVANAGVWTKIPDPFDPGLSDGQRRLLAEKTASVAAAGWRLWSDLRQDAQMRTVLDALGKLPPGSRISIVTDAVFVPWEVLYPEDPEDPAGPAIKPGLFWGARYIVSTALYEDDWRPSEERREHAARATGAVLCVDAEVDRDFSDLDPPPAASHARWAEDFARSKNLPIETLAPDAARTLLINGTNVEKWIYVFCHIRAGVDGREDELVLAENRVIKPSNLNQKPRFVGRPIVFLNSCGSGAHDPLSLNNFYKGFRRTKQVLGLVVTSFPVPTVTAAAIGRRISGLYLDGSHDLGSALLAVRRDLLDRGIPIGLFYTLNAPGDARAVPSSTSEVNDAR